MATPATLHPSFGKIEETLSQPVCQLEFSARKSARLTGWWNQQLQYVGHNNERAETAPRRITSGYGGIIKKGPSADSATMPARELAPREFVVAGKRVISLNRVTR